jgi:hypothetical protein
MAELGQTLTNKVGGLPTWAWAGIGTAGLGGYLIYRKKQSVSAQQAASAGNATSTNLGTVPISNLTTQAEPMPVSVGPTFVNVALPGQSTPATSTPASGYGSNNWQNLNSYEANILAHTPVAGYTGNTWSQLSQTQHINLFAHTPVPGYTGAQWSKLNASQQLQLWASYDQSNPNKSGTLKNPNGSGASLSASTLQPAQPPQPPPPATIPQTTS